MQEISFKFQNECPTIFVKDDNNIWLTRLFGLACGFCGRDEGPLRTRGLFLLDTNIGRFESVDLVLKESYFEKDRFSIVWQASDSPLRVKSKWAFCSETGIWSRKDILENRGKEPITVFRCLARFPFSPGNYEVYSQNSRWCNENQGSWQSLINGSIVLGCEGGRTCQGSTPYVCLREKGSKHAIAFHILPRGNWRIRISAHNIWGESLPFAVVELGLADESLKFNITADSLIELSEIFFQTLPEGEVHSGTPRLHRYLIKNKFFSAKSVAPVVYNTWFDNFHHLDLKRLRDQLVSAKEIGCEAFVVDAGWYGINTNWWSQVGDWRENPNAAFHGHMADFAEEVRSSGLGFGLWMEPEHLGSSAPILKEHPEWFISTKDNYYYPDLTKHKVYSYMLAEMSRLVATYKLAWMKIDFNFDMGIDPLGGEFSLYYEAWYRLLDELRAKYPQVFFEGCASGGMRLDIETLSHFDGHFLTDTTNPIDVLRIYQGALLRLPPGRLGKWAVLRSVGHSIPKYGKPFDSAPVSLVAPAGATWDSSVTIDLDFAVRVCLPGMFGLSGDIFSLPKESHERLRHHIEFFKKWRNFIAGSIGYLLTPPLPKNDRSGWAAIQLQHPVEKTSLLFVYRLDDASDKKWLRLRGLDEKCKYLVKNEDQPEVESKNLSGRQLMNEGLEVECANRNSALVFVISPVSRPAD